MNLIELSAITVWLVILIVIIKILWNWVYDEIQKKNIQEANYKEQEISRDSDTTDDTVKTLHFDINSDTVHITEVMKILNSISREIETEITQYGYCGKYKITVKKYHHWRWTYTKPSKKGFYWVTCCKNLSREKYDTIVPVYTAYNDQWYVYCDGENFPLDSNKFIRWSDKPIECPT